jgi:hypothetical protein
VDSPSAHAICCSLLHVSSLWDSFPIDARQMLSDVFKTALSDSPTVWRGKDQFLKGFESPSSHAVERDAYKNACKTDAAHSPYSMLQQSVVNYAYIEHLSPGRTPMDRGGQRVFGVIAAGKHTWMTPLSDFPITMVPMSLYLSITGIRKEAIGSRVGGSVASNASKRVGPSHQSHTSDLHLPTTFSPPSAAMGKNTRSLAVL